MPTDPVQTTAATYREIAQAYSDANLKTTLPKRDLDEFIEELRLRHGMIVLDVGCGNGRDAKYFCDNGLSVLGVDLCEKLLNIAQTTAPKAHFMRGDMRDLGFIANSTFDGVWGSSSFLHVPKSDAARTLGEFRRVLVPRGVIYLSVKKGSNEEFVSQPYSSPRFFANYQLDEFKRLFETEGFIVVTDFDYATNPKWIGLIAEKQ